MTVPDAALVLLADAMAEPYRIPCPVCDVESGFCVGGGYHGGRRAAGVVAAIRAMTVEQLAELVDAYCVEDEDGPEPHPRDPDVPIPPCAHAVWDSTADPVICAVCGEPIPKERQ